MPLLFTVTLFVSALLLFLVQPMVGKAVLPLLGGTPAVWNTCMVFFQAALLAGYLYAHAITTRLAPRKQLVLHLGVLALALGALAFLRFDAYRVLTFLPPPEESSPIPWLLGLLVVTAGLPFFAVATSAPLLQKWFADTGHPSGRDPYFLYSASNLGSMLALAGYPLLVERQLRLAEQAWVWLIGYGVLVVLIALCGLCLWRSVPADWRPKENSEGDQTNGPSWLRRLRWVALAFVPSSLMLGVTTYITTDVAPVAFLWVLPLGLYLLTFILVFARLPMMLHWVMIALLLPLVVLIGLPEGVGVTANVTRLSDLAQRMQGVVVLDWIASGILAFTSLSGVIHVILLHLTVLFVAAMVCHGELAQTRPGPKHLTEFYLWMSLGGVLGGAFNGLVAPVVFDRLVEYPLVLALALLLLPRFRAKSEDALFQGVDYGFATVLGLVGLFAAINFVGNAYPELRLQSAIAGLPEPVRRTFEWFKDSGEVEPEELLFRGRNFFGTIQVKKWQTEAWQEDEFHYMAHGTTDHGLQHFFDPNDPESRLEPLSYFHRAGPVGQIFRALESKPDKRHMAVLGVGTGTLAAYGKPGWEITLYEIDHTVVKLARDPKLFTFLTDAEKRGVKIDIHMGDGRLQLQKAAPQSFDILFMDAFASDSVPIHLLTREALQAYFSKLKPGGFVVVNIANRYLDLHPVLGNLAKDLGISGIHASDEADYMIYKYGSHWVVLAQKSTDLDELRKATREDGTPWFAELEGREEVGVWTDDFSNLLSVYKWKD